MIMKQLIVVTPRGPSLRSVPSEVALQLPRGIVREDALQAKLTEYHARLGRKPLVSSLGDAFKERGL
jgi:hypothetical protein